MIESVVSLYDSDIMMTYTNSGAPPDRTRMLTLHHKGVLHFFHIVHAAVDQINQPAAGYAEHNHNDYFHLVLYTEKGGTFSYLGKESAVEKGHLLLISPGEKHSFDTRGEACCYSEVTFSLLPEGEGDARGDLDFRTLFMLLAGRELESFDMPLRLADSDREEMVFYFNHLLQGLNRNSPSGEFIWQQALGSQISLLCREYFLKRDDSIHKKDESGFEKARSYIEINYTRTIDADTLAALAQVSRGHFFRKFRLLYGMTFARYQRSLRINASKNLLKIGDQPNRVIAEQLGFSDVYHFSRTFKQETGMTPGEYRRLH